MMVWECRESRYQMRNKQLFHCFIFETHQTGVPLRRQRLVDLEEDILEARRGLVHVMPPCWRLVAIRGTRAVEPERLPGG